MKEIRQIIYVVVLIVLMLLAAGSIWATSIRLVNLLEMVQLAERVFWGKCISAIPQEAGAGVIPVIEYVFQVEGGIKGVDTGERVVFRQLRGSQEEKVGVPGMPVYQKDQEFLLFLHGDSRLGLTSPVGFAQGVFEVRRTEQGEIRVINALENRNLSHLINVKEASASGIDQAELSQVEKTEAIPIELLSSLVTRVDMYQVRKAKSTR